MDLLCQNEVEGCVVWEEDGFRRLDATPGTQLLKSSHHGVPGVYAVCRIHVR